MDLDDIELKATRDFNGSNKNWCKENELELIEELVQTIHDLQLKDIITLRNGDELILSEDNKFKDIKRIYYNNVISLDDFYNDLTYKNRIHEDFDIIKVERPIYSTIYNRTDNPKEMTLEEIS